MATLQLSETFSAPIERVFHLFTDIPNAAARIPEIRRIEMRTDGPVAPGTKWLETRTLPHGEVTLELEVVAMERNRFIRIENTYGGSLFTSEYRFSPDGAGTRVELEVTMTAQTLGAKLLTPVSMLMLGPMKTAMEKELKHLGKLAESG